MMQVLMRWRSVFMHKTTMAQSTGIAAAAVASTNHLAMFHSSNVCFEKWENKFQFQQDVRESQKPSKDYIRYSVRQKGVDTKKAIKSILYSGGCSTKKAEIETDYEDQLRKKSRTKRARKALKAKRQKIISRHRKEKCFEDFDNDRESELHASFGKHGCTWTFRLSEMGSDWTEFSHWNHHKFGEAYSSRFDSEYNPYIIGSYEDRKTLGLPSAGPLKVEDVKSAFRLSALKWHPDKHPEDTSRATAEEKFRNCVNAYKSLCDALSAP